MHFIHRNLSTRLSSSRKSMAGVTLIELMVAVAISGFLMIGAITVFMQARTSFRINESVARLQENARFVLDTLEPDIRMSHFWGLNTRTYAVVGRTASTELHAAWAGDDDCGDNWAIDLENVVGSNDGYDWECDPFGEEVEGADTLMVRRAAQQPVDAATQTANTVLLQSGRGGTPAAQLFLAGDPIPADFNPDTSDTFRLIAHGYYVDQSSALGEIPSLRRKTLVAGGAINDEEVLPGVEDLQVEYGVDTNPVGAPTRGSITRYVTADDAILAAESTEVLAVRVWVRLRAERPENGFVDTAEYVYADRDEGPFNDAFRRLVVSKTIYLRNARPAS